MGIRVKREVKVYPPSMARVLLNQMPTSPQKEHRLIMAIIQIALDDISSPSRIKSDRISAKLFFSRNGFFDIYCANLGLCSENAREMIIKAGYDIPRKGE